MGRAPTWHIQCRIRANHRANRANTELTELTPSCGVRACTVPYVLDVHDAAVGSPSVEGDLKSPPLHRYRRYALHTILPLGRILTTLKLP